MRKGLFFIIILAVAICLGISIGTNATYALAEESIKHQEGDEEYYYNVNKSIEIYDEAMDLFRNKKSVNDSNEKAMYQNDFGGVFIDEKGYLNIGLVGLQETKKDYDGQVIYRPQRHSYNYLLKIKDNLELVMAEYEIYSVSIDEKLNRVNTYLKADCYIDHIVKYLQEKNLYEKEALNFIYDFYNEVVEDSNTAYGGDKLNNWLFTSGTLCVNAVDNSTGKFGVLTNEHVAQNYTMYLGGSGALGPKIGKASKSQKSGTIDAAFIPFNNQNNWNITTHAKVGSTTYTNIKLGTED